MSSIKKGIYQHYKGGKYEVIEEALSSDDKSVFIVYRSLTDNKVWVRLRSEFLSKVRVDGQVKDRFKLLEEKSLDDWENKYKRALADYQNLLKQSAKDKEEFTRYAISEFLIEILPVYSHLKLSLAGLSIKDSQSPWAEGVKHVLKQFKDVLARNGLEEIPTKGKKFDHNTMEAVGGKGDTVKEELMPGYKLHDRVIQAAKVIVK